MDTLDAIESTTDGLEVNEEKMIQAKMIMAPSRHTSA